MSFSTLTMADVESTGAGAGSCPSYDSASASAFASIHDETSDSVLQYPSQHLQASNSEDGDQLFQDLFGDCDPNFDFDSFYGMKPNNSSSPGPNETQSQQSQLSSPVQVHTFPASPKLQAPDSKSPSASKLYLPAKEFGAVQAGGDETSSTELARCESNPEVPASSELVPANRIEHSSTSINQIPADQHEFSSLATALVPYGSTFPSSTTNDLSSVYSTQGTPTADNSSLIHLNQHTLAPDSREPSPSLPGESARGRKAGKTATKYVRDLKAKASAGDISAGIKLGWSFERLAEIVKQAEERTGRPDASGYTIESLTEAIAERKRYQCKIQERRRARLKKAAAEGDVEAMRQLKWSEKKIQKTLASINTPAGSNNGGNGDSGSRPRLRVDTNFDFNAIVPQGHSFSGNGMPQVFSSNGMISVANGVGGSTDDHSEHTGKFSANADTEPKPEHNFRTNGRTVAATAAAAQHSAVQLAHPPQWLLQQPIYPAPRAMAMTPYDNGHETTNTIDNNAGPPVPFGDLELMRLQLELKAKLEYAKKAQEVAQQAQRAVLQVEVAIEMRTAALTGQVWG